jgi:hypothetical protein
MTQPITSQEERQSVISQLFAEGKLIRPISVTDDAPNLEPIWGNWMFKQSIILQVGEPGISKSTFNYKFSDALLHNKPFLGINGVHPDVSSLLQIDLESSDSLVKARRSLLEIEDHPRFLMCNSPNVTLKDLEDSVDKTVTELANEGCPISIVFVDPIRAAFRMKDENDNAEASQQMMYVRYLSQKWNCAIVLVHHSSKAELGGTKKGSGAYARAALADIVWNFEKILDKDGEEIDPDLFKFYIPKSRYIQDDFCACIRKSEGDFTIEEFPPDYKVRATGTKIYTLQLALGSIMADMQERTPQDMMNILEKEKVVNASRPSLHKAITALIQLGIITKCGHGRYRHT